MTTRTRPSFTVGTLDTDKATEVVRQVILRDYPEADVSDYRAMPMVVVNGKDGIATVCCEGVGWTIDSKGLYTLMFLGTFSQSTVDVTLDELKSCFSTEQTDLANFIRVFGDRLESNFDLWHSYGYKHEQELQVS